MLPTGRYITLSGENNLLSQHCFNSGQALQTKNQHKGALGQHIMIAGNLHLSHHNRHHFNGTIQLKPLCTQNNVKTTIIIIIIIIRIIKGSLITHISHRVDQGDVQ